MAVEHEVKRFESFDGVGIAYAVVAGDRQRSERPAVESVAFHGSDVTSSPSSPVVLHHGFASDWRTNWVRPRVVDALAAAGFAVVLVDARGHGLSDKPHDPESYREDAMVRDVVGLVRHLGLSRFDFVGYSMGAFVGIGLALDSSVNDCLRRLVLGGAGSGQRALSEPDRSARIAEALESPDPSRLTDPTGRAFRSFADATGADRLALAAIQRSGSGPLDPSMLARVRVPTLVLNGDRDTLVGPVGSFAEAIPGARLELVPGDHISAVMRPQFAKAVIEFLSG